MNLDDPQWPHLLGGYRVPYDPRKALFALEENGDAAAAWKELWTGLYHQGDVGEASYAAVPHLVRIHVARGVADWNTYALAATIEDARNDGRNPELPSRLRDAYKGAWRKLVDLGLQELAVAEDPTLVAAILAVLCFGKGQTTLGRLAIAFTEDERKDMIDSADRS